MRSLFRTLLALGLGLSPLVVTQLLSAPTTSAQGSTPPAALIVLDASGCQDSTGKVPISDAEYPIRIMANVAPFVAKTSATPTPSASPTATEAAPPTADSGTSPWVWVGIGVVVLGAAVIAMLVVLTKRNRAGRTAPSNPRF